MQEHNFRSSSLSESGKGLCILLRYSAFISQIIASWNTATRMVLSVQLPSGVEYTIKNYDTAPVTSLVLNHRNSGSDDFVYWTKLPANSKIRFGVDSAQSAPGDIEISIIAKPVQ